MNLSLFRRPSACLPPAMSLIVIAVIIGHITIAGTAREADEGTAAHIFQLLVAGQAPIVAFFAIKWLPREPGPASLAALQFVAAMAAMFPVWWFGW